MARAVWSGAISFGLVSVPVKAFSATKDHAVHFHQLDANGNRIKYEKVSAKTGKPVEKITKGYETSKGHYVTFADDELDELKPASSRTIDVTDFVALADIDPIYYHSTYWLAPDGDAVTKAYSLLLAAMDEQQKVGIGSVVMRNKQYLAAIRPLDGALAMSTMRFGDEVVAKSKVDQIPRRVKPSPKEMKLATQIIESLDTDWDPKRYKDTYTDELRSIIERKAKGEDVVVEPGADADNADVLDLMEALQKSVESAKKARAKPVSKTSKRTSTRRSA